MSSIYPYYIRCLVDLMLLIMWRWTDDVAFEGLGVGEFSKLVWPSLTLHFNSEHIFITPNMPLRKSTWGSPGC